MSSERKDFADIEQLLVNDKRARVSVTTAVQSAALLPNSPSIILFGFTSAAMVQFLPAEADTFGKEMEFFVVGTASANLLLKNASGDLKVVVPPNGYGKAVNIKGVWYGAAGGVAGTLSQVSLGADQANLFTSATSAIGFSSVTDALAFQTLVNAMKNQMIAHGWTIT